MTGSVGLAATLWQWFSGSSFWESIPWGIGAGAAAFFAWALSRELDPDHDYSAFVGAALTIAAVVIVEDVPELLPLFWLLLASRVLNRTTGLPSTLLDTATLLILGAWLAFTELWLFAVLSALALLVDGMLPPRRRQPILMSGLSFSIALTALPFSSTPFQLHLDAGLLALVFSALFVPVAYASRQPQSTCDYTGNPLDSERLLASQVILAVSGILIALLGGFTAMLAILPLWAAQLGTAFFWIVNRLLPTKPGHGRSAEGPHTNP